MAVRNPVSWLQLRNDHTAENDRLTFGALLSSPPDGTHLNIHPGGVRWDDGNSFKVVPKTGMTVTVHAGHAFVKGNQGGTEGLYVVTNDTDFDVTLNAADSTNPRKDIVFVQVLDANYTGSLNQGQISYLAGTPGVGAPAPALPNNSLLLATITVAAHDTSIGSADINDGRKAVVAAGGIQPVQPSAGLNYPTTLWIGRSVYNWDTHNLEFWDGDDWRGPNSVPFKGWSTFQGTFQQNMAADEVSGYAEIASNSNGTVDIPWPVNNALCVLDVQITPAWRTAGQVAVWQVQLRPNFGSINLLQFTALDPTNGNQIGNKFFAFCYRIKYQI
jgi:hypothetical protein